GRLHIQILGASFVMFLCILAQVGSQPFESVLMDYTESVALFSAFGLFFLGNFFFVESGNTTEVRELITIAILLLIGAYVSFLVGMFVFIARITREGRLSQYLKQIRHIREIMDAAALYSNYKFGNDMGDAQKNA